MATDSESLKLIFEGIVAVGVLGGGMIMLLKLGSIGNQIENHGVAIEKIEETLATMASQKVELQGLRERQQQDTQRTDESFRRVFQILDRLHDRKAS